MADVERFFHININCTDFEASLEFYKAVGYEVVNTFEESPRRTFGEIGLGPVLGLPDDCDGRAVLMQLPGDDGGTKLDVIEWLSPMVAPRKRESMAQPGVGRICLKTADAGAVHARLVAKGYRPYTAPTLLRMGGSRINVFCCEDPDGVVIEFMEFLGRDKG